jgi:hypothetical protein
MTTDVIRYSGDLKLATAVGGTITLDTGVTTGTVIITGNLNVLGTQTNISSTNTIVKDNILTLNAGEPNSYVSQGEANIPFYGQSGFVIDRGNTATIATRASFLFEERTWSSTGTTASQYQGIWTIKTANKHSAVELGAVRLGGGAAGGPNNDGRLNFLGSGFTQMLSVKGQLSYASRVTDDDDIPNKAYVDNSPLRGTATNALIAQTLRVGNTYITIEDDNVPPTSTSKITMAVDSSTQVQLFNGYMTLGPAGNSLSLIGNTIRPTQTNRNLVLQTLGTGTVIVNNGISIGLSSGAPLPDVGVVKLWTTSTVGAGSTGVRFEGFEDVTGTVPTSGELISARKALVLAIIF